MAEGDAAVHNNFKEQLMKKTIDLVGDTIKCALYTASYTWSPDGADTAYSATNELSATNYTATGQALSGKAVAQDDTNDRANWTASNVTWNSLGASSPRHALLYDDTTATKWVLMHFELATDANGGNYTLAWNANGILLLQ